MKSLQLSSYDGTYHVRLMEDEVEADQFRASGACVVQVRDEVYEAYRAHVREGVAWDAYFTSLANDDYRERELAEARERASTLEAEVEELRGLLEQARSVHG